MADSTGDTERIPIPVASGGDSSSGTKWPASLILGCILVAILISASIAYIVIHLWQQDVLLREQNSHLKEIENQLCIVAVHDSRADHRIALHVGVRLGPEPKIICHIPELALTAVSR